MLRAASIAILIVVLVAGYWSAPVTFHRQASSLESVRTAAAADQPSPASTESAPRDVRSWGAVGDGHTDDSAAVARAVTESQGRIHFGPGTYVLSRTIEIDLDQVGPVAITGDASCQIVMTAPGPAFRLIGTHQRSADPEGFTADVWDRQRMPLIDGLAIRGEHPGSIGIQADGTMQLIVTRVHLRGLLHGIHLVGNNRNVIVSDCQIYHNRGVGIYYDQVNLHQSNIQGSHISYNNGGGIVSRGGNVRNIHITGCDLESNMGNDLPPTANVLIDCRESAYGTAEVAITGCTIQHNHRARDSANIRIIGESLPRAGKRVREGHVTITGNVLSDVATNIHLVACRGTVITGNTFWMGFDYNLWFQDCAHIIVGVNNFDRNPRYDYGDAKQARNRLLVEDCQDCTFQGLHLCEVAGSDGDDSRGRAADERDSRGEAAWTIRRCQRMHVQGCTILDSLGTGLKLEEVSDSHIAGCVVRQASQPACEITGGNGNTVFHCVLSSSPRMTEGERHTLQGVHVAK